MAAAVAGSSTTCVHLQHAAVVHDVTLESSRAQRRSSFSSDEEFVDALSGEDDDFDD